MGWCYGRGDTPSDKSIKAVSDNIIESGIPPVECIQSLTWSTIWTNQKVVFSGLCQELLRMHELCEVSCPRWWSNACTVCCLRRKGQSLILIYHTNVFAPRVRHNELSERWSGALLIYDILLKSGLVWTVAACLSLGWAYVTWVLSSAAKNEARFAGGLLNISGWYCGCGIVDLFLYALGSRLGTRLKF